MMINGRMNESEGKYGGRGGRSDVEEEMATEMKMLDDAGSLCEQCRAEEGAERSAEERARELSRMLAQQIREMNRAEMDRKKAWMKEEGRLEEREWMKAEERYRTEEKARKEERKMERRAKSGAEEEEQGGWRQEESRRRREETEMSNLGRTRPSRIGSSTFLSLDNGGMRKIGQKEDEGLMKRLDDQLRRNEALRESVERLEQFKERQREEDERARSRASEARRAMVAMERARSSSSSAFHRSPSSGGRRTRQDMATTTASPARSRVYEAWREAREADAERYRILQEGGKGGRRKDEDGEDMRMKMMIGERRKKDEEEKLGMIRERKRCRKCNKPI